MANTNPLIPKVNIISQEPVSGYIIDGEIVGSPVALGYVGAGYAGIFQLECTLRDSGGTGIWQMTGTVAVPAWSLMENGGDQPLDALAYNLDSTAGAVLLTAAKMIYAWFDRDGGATNRIDTTPTAALLIAGLPGAIVGSTFNFVYRNVSTTPGQFQTLAAGANVTISGNFQIVAGATQLFKARVTSITGAGAVTLYAVNDTAGVLSEVITASTINSLLARTAATGVGPSLEAVGGDTNIDVGLVPKGTGNVKIAGGRGISSSVSNALGGFKVAAAIQAISGPGAITLTQYKTHITSTGADAFTLANGTVIGMLKKIQFIVDGGDATLTPVSLSGGTTITFTVVGDWVELMWNGTAWVMIDSGSVLGTAATPALA